MRLVGVVTLFAIALDLPGTASGAAQEAATPVQPRRAPTVATAESPLIADCTETSFVPKPLHPRPARRRATVASRPSAPQRHHAKPKNKPHAVKYVRHKAVHHPRHHAVHHRAPHHPHHKILHRVTYASPLCSQRSPAINHMLGLPDYAVTQPPIPGDDTSVVGYVPDLVDVPTGIGFGPGPITPPIGPGPIVFPPPIGPGPIVFPGPVGPGPIIAPPPGPPVSPPPPPPVTPPVTVSFAPEPSSWATMLLGMLVVGGSVRRRSARRAPQ